MKGFSKIKILVKPHEGRLPYILSRRWYYVFICIYFHQQNGMCEKKRILKNHKYVCYTIDCNRRWTEPTFSVLVQFQFTAHLM